jgi:hypothetical protein
VTALDAMVAGSVSGPQGSASVQSPPRSEARVGRSVLRPQVRRVGLKTFASGLAFIVPVYGVAVALAADAGHLMSTIMSGSALACAAALVAVRMASARIELSDAGIVEHGILPRGVVTDRSELASALIVPVYDADGVKARPQLFIADAAGRTLLRMRGGYWSAKQINAVAMYFGISIVVSEPLTRVELRRRHGIRLYWFERHPRLAWLGKCVASLAVIAVLITSVNGAI